MSEGRELPQKRYLAPNEVADFYNFNVKTLYGWIAEGKVPADRIGPGRIIRIRRDVAERLAQPAVS